jgi:hypothetical protein
MMAFFYRNANATLDAVATNEGNEVIEEITGMSSSLESYSIYCTSAEVSYLVLLCQNIAKQQNPGNRFEQKIRELISATYLSQIFCTQESCLLLFTFASFYQPYMYVLYNSYSLPYFLLNTCGSMIYLLQERM